MIIKLLKLFVFKKKNIQIKSENFLSYSENHYDLDYRIKYLDHTNKF